jgi:NADH-quinone oxidoreductase subunit C
MEKEERVNKPQASASDPEDQKGSEADRESPKKPRTESNGETAANDQVKDTTANTADADAKRKAAAAARAKAAAAARAKPAGAGRNPAARKAEAKEKPLEPSPKQPVLDAFVTAIRKQVGDDAVEEAMINRPNHHLPTIVVPKEKWLEVARLLKEEDSLAFDYLQNLSGVDYETHMEVVYHLYSFRHRHSLCVRVKTERDEARVDSVTSVWLGADWNEREVYDLLGIRFDGHPYLKRIFLPEHWEGHPLRKDYEPLDPEI